MSGGQASIGPCHFDPGSSSGCRYFHVLCVPLQVKEELSTTCQRYTGRVSSVTKASSAGSSILGVVCP